MNGTPATAERPQLTGSLILVGAGKMGGALLTGWLDIGLDPSRIVVLDPQADRSTLAGALERGVRLNPDRTSLETAEVLVLAVKPQVMNAVGSELAALADAETLLVSILAGKTVRDLTSAFPSVGAIARVMPNTPASIRQGISGIHPDARVSDSQRHLLGALLGAVGAVEWFDDEASIDAVTAVSGSGPAYVFLLTECLARAGEALGLAPEVAFRLARATVEGAGALMAAEPNLGPDQLRRNVTSPGGTTAAALDVLMADDRLAHAMRDAVAAAHERARALSG